MEQKKREIKFRVWNLDRKEWAEYGVLDMNGSFKQEGVEYHEYNYVIQLFTGLLDDNGKEIYEGDILRRGGASVVKFGDFYAGGNNEYYNQYVKSSFYIEFKDGDVDALDDGEEVIGNIYENPNLLSEKEE